MATPNHGDWDLGADIDAPAGRWQQEATTVPQQILMKRRPNPYRPKLVVRAVRKLAADLNYRTPRSRRSLRYAVLEWAQAEAVLRVLKGHSGDNRQTSAPLAKKICDPPRRI